MLLTKEIAEQENRRTTTDCKELHLWKEGSFLRAYDWSAFLSHHGTGLWFRVALIDVFNYLCNA